MQTRSESITNQMEEYQNYIERLYHASVILSREEFVSKTEWKDFVSVIEDDTARFIKLLLQIKRPVNILEIGMSIGFSATSMALTARSYGGRITSVEFDPIAYEQAKINFKRSGVDQVITPILGDACKVLPNLPDESFDLVFQDVDNRLYPKLLDDCIRVLKPGGILLADDVLFPVMDLGEELADQVEPIDRFNHLVIGMDAIESTLLPIGDGLMVCVKK